MSKIVTISPESRVAAMKQPDKDGSFTDDQLKTILDTAVDVGAEILALRQQMREAIERGDMKEQYRLARVMVGLPPEKPKE